MNIYKISAFQFVECKVRKLKVRKVMTGRVVHPTLRGPSDVKDVCLGLTVAISVSIDIEWKM